jgi:hypothetical protein
MKTSLKISVSAAVIAVWSGSLIIKAFRQRPAGSMHAG